MCNMGTAFIKRYRSYYFDNTMVFIIKLFCCTLFALFVHIITVVSPIKRRPLLIVSYDGFRYDFLTRVATPNFDRVIEQGVHATEGLNNVFVTSTLTNHWSMVTGLFAESHGIIENEMFDPVIKKMYVPLYRNRSAVNDPRYYDDNNGEPLWVTNQKHGGLSGSMQWWGAENSIKGIRPTYHVPFNKKMPSIDRIEMMVDWFTRRFPINFGLLYFSEPDQIAHKTGPESQNVTRMIKYVDELTGILLARLEEREVLDKLNIIITSDHGHISISRDRLIYLDNIVDPNTYKMVRFNPVAAILPNKGQEDIIYKKLKKASKSQPFTVYRKADIPERLHYKKHNRVTPIIAMADLGYSFLSRISVKDFKNLGNHGYDNKYKEMHPFFMAMGPDFKTGKKVKTFNSVDLYPLMCRLLGIKPLPNNGTMSVVSQFLINEGDPTEIWTFTNYLYIYVVVIAVFGLAFFSAAFRKNRFLRQKKNSSSLPNTKARNNKDSSYLPLVHNQDSEHEIL